MGDRIALRRILAEEGHPSVAENQQTAVMASSADRAASDDAGEAAASVTDTDRAVLQAVWPAEILRLFDGWNRRRLIVRSGRTRSK